MEDIRIMAELREARRPGRTVDMGARDAARALAERLNREIDRGHEVVAFTIAFLLALVKDGLDVLLDLFIVGEIPIVGQLPGIFLSAFIAYFLWGKGWFIRTRIKIIFFSLALVFDNLPFGVNNLPINTLAVLWAWHTIRRRAADAEHEMDDLSREVRTMTQ